MNCSDFEALWQEVLDARAEGRPDLEWRLDGHAASCEPCRATSARYRVLRGAVAALARPAIPAGSMARLRDLRVPATRAASPSGLRWAWVPLASAAALLAIAQLGDRGPREPAGPGPAGPPPLGVRAAAGPLGRALAEASRATIELAREASAPAARIGREALDLDDLAGGPPGELAPIDGGSSPDAPGLFREVGERVNAGVRPITGSARHAFGFLLGPPPGPTNPPPAGPRDGL